MEKFTLRELYDFQTKVTNADFKSVFGSYEAWHKFLDCGRNVATLHVWLSDRTHQQSLARLVRNVLGK